MKVAMHAFVVIRQCYSFALQIVAFKALEAERKLESIPETARAVLGEYFKTRVT
jgi:hypothetical protein